MPPTDAEVYRLLVTEISQSQERLTDVLYKRHKERMEKKLPPPDVSWLENRIQKLLRILDSVKYSQKEWNFWSTQLATRELTPFQIDNVLDFIEREKDNIRKHLADYYNDHDTFEYIQSRRDDV